MAERVESTPTPKVNGECLTAANFTYPTRFEHAPGEKKAFFTSGTHQEAYFSRDPDSYVLHRRCVSRVVNGYCVERAFVNLFVNKYPPNQLDWWKITCDLRRVMGFTLQDPRFQFTGFGAVCPGELD